MNPAEPARTEDWQTYDALDARVAPRPSRTTPEAHMRRWLP